MRNTAKDEIEMAAKRDAMLKEGFRLFSEKGIEPVSMQEVADACKVGIATLYRYYNTKLSLVIAIGTRKWEEFGEFLRHEKEICGTDGMNAAEELDFYLGCYVLLYRTQKDLLRFNQDFNNYVKHEMATPEQLAPYINAIGAFAGMFHGVYEKGKRDGTIRTDLSEEKMFAATSHIMTAVAVRYAQGLVYAAEREEDRTEEYELLRKMVLREFVVAKD